MGDWHSAEITIGDVTHTVYADPADVPDGASVYVLDDLRLRTNWSEPAPVQGAYGPWSASLSLGSSDLQALTAVNIGDKVCIEVWSHPPGSTLDRPGRPIARLPLVQFLGRVSDLLLTLAVSTDPVTGQPRHQLALTVTDRIIDYSQITVGLVDWPQELAADRVQRIYREAGFEPGYDFLYGTVAARKASPIGFVDALAEVWIGVTDPNPEFPWTVSFPVLNIGFDVVDPDTAYVRFHKDPDSVTPIIRSRVDRDRVISPEDYPELPGLLVGYDALGDDGEVVPQVDLIIDPIINADAVRCIDASRVDASGIEWSKSRADRIDRVEVTTGDDPQRTLTISQDYPLPVVHRIETQLVSVDSAPIWIARANLPPAVDNSYGVPEVTIVSLDDASFYPWLLQYAAVNGLRQNVVVYNVDPARNPTGRSWFVGIPSQAEIAFRRGKWTIGLKLRADSARPYAWTANKLAANAPLRPGYLSWESITDSALAATTWRALAPTLTWRDLRLARRP